MTIDLNTAIAGITGIVTGLGGIYTGFKHLKASSNRKKEAYKESILCQASQDMEKIRLGLEEKIKIIEIELENQKQNVSKDFEHFKDTHNAEVKVLGEKIESLRQDLSQQHQALVNLLTKLIDSR
jgi:hypothetical protein